MPVQEKIDPKATELHVALDVPREAARQIHQWVRDQSWPEGTQLEEPRDYHVTLLYSSEGNEHKDAWWLQHMDQAEVTITNVSAFPAQEGNYAYVLLIDSDEIQTKAEEMQGKAESFGLPITHFDGGYKPHITVAYGPSSRLTGITAPKFQFDVGPSSVSPMRPKSASTKETIAVDFDGVIHEYHGWNEGKVDGDPMPGAKEGLADLAQKYQVVIFTARDDLAVVRKWLRQHELDQYVDEVTNKKPPAKAYVDDRAVHFEDWDTLKISSKPPRPPNYRDGTPNRNCGNCKMMFKGHCWGYGNVPVEKDDVCDSWAAEEKRSAYNPDEVQVLDHLSLTSIAANIHYKFEEGGLDAHSATDYAKRLLKLIGYPPDDITVDAALQAWHKLYPDDKIQPDPSQLQAPATTPTESWGYGTKSSNWEGIPFDEVTGQGPREKDTPPERTPEGHLVFYHGTSPEGAQRIMSEKRLRPDDLQMVGISTTPGQAQSFSAMKRGPVLRVGIHPDELGQFTVKREIGGSGRNQFLIGHRDYRPWDGGPTDQKTPESVSQPPGDQMRYTGGDGFGSSSHARRTLERGWDRSSSFGWRPKQSPGRGDDQTGQGGQIGTPSAFGVRRGASGVRAPHPSLDGGTGASNDFASEVLEPWESRGLTVLHEETPDQLHIHTMELPSDLRGQGYGSRFMKHVKAYSDAKGKPVVIDPVTNPGFFNKFDWLTPDHQQTRYEYQPEGSSTIPSEVNSPEDHWPDVGGADSPRDHGVQVSNEWVYTS